MGKIFLLGLTFAFAAWRAFAQASAVERGKYLVNNVAMCADCHTPRLKNGQFDSARWLKGTILDFAPAQPVPAWAKYAPNITASGTRWSEQEIATLLSNGQAPGAGSSGLPCPHTG